MRAMKTGRNEPCPCGSGRKYKNCHLAADSAPAASQQRDEISPIHELDMRLVEDILGYAEQKFGHELLDAAELLELEPEMTLQFAKPWLAFIAPLGGRPAVESFLEDRGWSLSRGAQEWLAAQQKSWLSIWEIVDVEPGRTLTLRDRLTSEERVVHEVSGSRTAERHYLILGRVVDTGSISLICGMHAVSLRPQAGAAVVEEVRKALRRRTAVAPDRLRNPKTAERMLHAWSDAIDRLSLPPILENRDGHPLLLTTDRWTFEPSRRSEIVARIASIEGADGDPATGAFAIVREDDTLVGSVEIGDASLIAETNSVARADELRAQIERRCESLLGPGLRSHSDPLAEWDRTDERDLPALPPVPEHDALIREVKEQHYAKWLDDRLPALDGKTPREAARTKRGRERLEAILVQMEVMEADVPEAVRYDIGTLRRALGMTRG